MRNLAPIESFFRDQLRSFEGEIDHVRSGDDADGDGRGGDVNLRKIELLAS